VFYERVRTMQFFQFEERTAWDIFAILAISSGAAVLLHILVEVPFRTPSVNRRKFVVGTFAGLAGCVLIGGFLVYSDGWVRRPWIVGAQYDAPAYQNWLGKRLKPLKESCVVAPNRPCSPDGSDRIHGLVIGNSHVVDGNTIMRTIEPTHALTMITTNGCGDLKGTSKNTRACADPTNLRYSPEYMRTFDYVVLSFRIFEDGNSQLLAYADFLHENGIKKVVILSNYMHSSVAFDDVVQMYGNAPLTLERFIYFPDQTHASLREYAQQNGYLFVDKRALVCGTAACPMLTPAGVPFSYDKHHLTYEYAQFMAGFLKPEITTYLAQP
jgi:hypothetical protein